MQPVSFACQDGRVFWPVWLKCFARGLAGIFVVFGASPSGKAQGFDPCIPRFESWRPSHILKLRFVVVEGCLVG